MRKLALLTIFIFFTSGCTSFPPAIPENYDGPIAKIYDSTTVRGRTTSDMFYVLKVNDIKIDNSAIRSQGANNGNGPLYTPVVIGREIPAGAPTRLLIRGSTQVGAPIMLLMTKVYDVEGEVTFVPQPGSEYEVRGELNKEYQGVWIIDRSTGELVVSKTEKHQEI